MNGIAPFCLLNIGKTGSASIWLVEGLLTLHSTDQSRVKTGYATENLTIARQVTTNLLKLDTSMKTGIKNKRQPCGWNEDNTMKVPGLVDM